MLFKRPAYDQSGARRQDAQTPVQPMAPKSPPIKTRQNEPGFWSDPETGMNIVKGIGKGIFSTIASMGKVGTQTLGRLVGAQDIEGTVEMVDTAKEGILKPKNTAQSLGFGAEQIAELFIPIFGQEAAGARVTSNLATRGFGKAVTTASRVGAQALTEGADIGVKRLAQTGDPKQAAIEAGLTVAATPVVIGAGKVLKEAYRAINPSTKQLFTSALKPSVKQKNFDLDLDESIPVLAKYADQISSSDAPLHAMDSAVKASKAELWSSIKEAVAGTSGSASVDGSRLANSIRQAMKSKKASIESPQIISKLEEKASAYEGQMIDPVDAEQLLEETNATLQAYYSKNKVGQAVAQKADPELAAEIKLAEDLRSQLDEIVSTVGSNFSDAKKRYGALSSIEQALASRIPVAERANITNIAEQISIGQTAGNFILNLASNRPMQAFASLSQAGASKLVKELETSGSKLSRAFSNISKDVKAGKISIAELPKFTREQFKALPEGKTIFAGPGSPVTPMPQAGGVSQNEAIKRLRELGYQGPLDLEDMTKAQREDAALRLKAWMERNSPKAQAGEVSGKIVEDPLISEAKKYKSAEEFVKAQGTSFHGTNTVFERFSKDKLGKSTGAKSAEKGFWFTDNQDIAKGYGEYSNDRKVTELLDQVKIAERNRDWNLANKLNIKAEELSAEYSDPVVISAKLNLANPMIYDAKGKGFLATDKKVNDLIDQAISNGNDGLIIKNLVDNVYYADTPSTHTIVFDENKILTKSQLTDIWNKANKK